MGNKQNKATPSPMLKVESRALSCFDEQERPRKGIPRRIGNVLLTRWIELKRREKAVLEKARRAVTNGHAPPSILEEFENDLKEEESQHRVKYHPRLLANILVRKAKPRPRSRARLRVPKLTTTAARRIYQSFLRRDRERQREEQERREASERTRSRVSLRQQAWTDTMPRKAASSATSRATQTIAQPLPFSRDISLRSFRTAESSGIGMSRASSMTSIASSRPRALYTRERGYSLPEGDGGRHDQLERSSRLEKGEAITRSRSSQSRRERIVAQRRNLRKQKLHSSTPQLPRGESRRGEREERPRGSLDSSRLIQDQGTSRRKTGSESSRNAGLQQDRAREVGERTPRRRPSAQQPTPEEDEATSSRRGRESSQNQESGKDEQKGLAFPKLKTISYQAYWRKRAMANRALTKGKDDTAKFRLPKGSITKQREDEPDRNSSPEPNGSGRKTVRQQIRERREQTPTTQKASAGTSVSQWQEELSTRRDSVSSDKRPPYSFCQRGKRFRDVAEEFLQAGRGARNSRKVEINELPKISQQIRRVSNASQQRDNPKDQEKARVVASSSDSGEHTTKHRYVQSNGEVFSGNTKPDQNYNQQTHFHSDERKEATNLKDENVASKQRQHRSTSYQRERTEDYPPSDAQPGPSKETTTCSVRVESVRHSQSQTSTENARQSGNYREESQGTSRQITKHECIRNEESRGNAELTGQSSYRDDVHGRQSHNQGPNRQAIDREQVQVEPVINENHASPGLTLSHDRRLIKYSGGHDRNHEPIGNHLDYEHDNKQTGPTRGHGIDGGHNTHPHIREHDQKHFGESTAYELSQTGNGVHSEHPTPHGKIRQIVDQGRMVQSQHGSRNAQLFSQSRREQDSRARQGQGQSQQQLEQEYTSAPEARGPQPIPLEYGHPERIVDYRQVRSVDAYRSDAAPGERGPAAMYETRMFQPLQQGFLEVSDGSGPRRWRRVSVVDVWELGEWERVRRAEEGLLRSRSSSMPAPRAL